MLFSEDELRKKDWREIKEIAEKMNIEKPEDGWLEAIPLILERQSSSPLPLEAEPLTTPTTLAVPAAKFPTNFYQAAKIECCPVCGEKKRFSYGQSICPLNHPNCPLAK